ncbi:MAG TPA: bifunctional phosphopantothenoylcysteine decarboxylase/phosphopantothenate--cysteine ligase CoaBC [Methylomirabilota bacterium]|jgi:phosphopantothenoylcysteine decarboxylase/phosphopantothenate--cysteine ligase|nr:bifunctional phosphopantothenoylcysteine decarboxylase/phosphopantothenate--cysteine ligase CoaBC [Methylomirabilota bacterium]
MTEDRGSLAGRRVVVGVAGSIAAYKAVSLVRLLAERGAIVDVAMTPAATQFVTPLTFASLTHRRVVDDVMALDAEQQIAHVELAEGADAIVIAPATANLLAELAAGNAGNAVTAIALASRAPLVVAPAMDAGMWTHPATQRNVETLRGFGHLIVEPEVGALASGLTGVGRLAEPETIVEAVERLFARAGDLDGLQVVVSAGGTREPIDPVRFIGNRSSGKMGVAIAEAARDRGASVTLIAGVMSVAPPRGVNVVDATTAATMRQAVLRSATTADVLVMAAAVADFAPKRASSSKIKRGGGDLQIDLVANPDIIAEVGEMADGTRPFLVGFAAESDDLEANARSKLRDKGLDLIVGNKVGGPFDAIGSDENKVIVFGAEGELSDWPMLPKRQVAERLWDLIVDRYRKAHPPERPERPARSRRR